MESKPDLDTLMIWRIRLNNCIGLMDDSGKLNEQGNSRLLWESKWNFLRNELFEVVEHLDVYVKPNTNKG